MAPLVVSVSVKSWSSTWSLNSGIYNQHVVSVPDVAAVFMMVLLLSFYLSVSVRLSGSVCQSVSLALALSLCLCPCVCVSLSVSLCLSLSVSVSLWMDVKKKYCTYSITLVNNKFVRSFVRSFSLKVECQIGLF